ncbi:DUF4268 domain-containing protein [Antarcticibacterium sp. 1MA-6-2]|uniref:DUF4268 domain-containing protein n=1 Tax=Antarcticibacterium sp. 1MA-6-2 TaxID=2908210 RepID=UPI001F340816|nr:DUF4268 domain-containing protein [Antarcticibacterium sp. 1MA-6-2]UJH91457.1 DUF4268 domain-containing protein [Antarcticibacterium sp. 1MA-6-2]
MFSREESKKIREEFWTSFGKEFPRKWILYNTQIKDLQLKFTFTNQAARVSLDLTSNDEILRAYYFEKLLSLKNILLTEYLPDAEFLEINTLPEGKVISTIFVELKKVNIHNKKDWPPVMEFLEDRMNLLEKFFLEYSDFIAD